MVECVLSTPKCLFVARRRSPAGHARRFVGVGPEDNWPQLVFQPKKIRCSLLSRCVLSPLDSPAPKKCLSCTNLSVDSAALISSRNLNEGGERPEDEPPEPSLSPSRCAVSRARSGCSGRTKTYYIPTSRVTVPRWGHATETTRVCEQKTFSSCFRRRNVRTRQGFPAH